MQKRFPGDLLLKLTMHFRNFSERMMGVEYKVIQGHNIYWIMYCLLIESSSLDSMLEMEY